jgi:hypothetical protein
MLCLLRVQGLCLESAAQRASVIECMAAFLDTLVAVGAEQHAQHAQHAQQQGSKEGAGASAGASGSKGAGSKGGPGAGTEASGAGTAATAGTPGTAGASAKSGEGEGKAVKAEGAGAGTPITSLPQPRHVPGKRREIILFGTPMKFPLWKPPAAHPGPRHLPGKRGGAVPYPALFQDPAVHRFMQCLLLSCPPFMVASACTPAVILESGAPRHAQRASPFLSSSLLLQLPGTSTTSYFFNSSSYFFHLYAPPPFLPLQSSWSWCSAPCTAATATPGPRAWAGWQH